MMKHYYTLAVSLTVCKTEKCSNFVKFESRLAVQLSSKLLSLAFQLSEVELHFKEADMFLLGLLMLLMYSSHIDGLSLRDPSIASNDKFGMYL